MRNRKKAVVLLSGGLDSATVLYLAKNKGYECLCLVFDYGQRHCREIESAKRIAEAAQCSAEVLQINLPWKGSSLLDGSINLVTTAPCLAGRQARHQVASNIPNTYVPGRNIIFLSFALSYAEAVGAGSVFIGAHDKDYSGYPDCRPEFYRAFKKVISSGTKAGVEKKGIKIHTPLIGKDKAQIIKLGAGLGVPYELTWSCYEGAALPCGSCDSCYFRSEGFKEAGILDPLLLAGRV